MIVMIVVIVVMIIKYNKDLKTFCFEVKTKAVRSILET